MGMVRLTQIDGFGKAKKAATPKKKAKAENLPNLALMKLAHWHKARGDEVILTTKVDRDLFEPAYDVVYGSTIFSASQNRIEEFRRHWPNAIISGTGIAVDGGITVEQLIGENLWNYEHYDYSIYPDFTSSIGFTQRGCRLNCKFCCVRGKEGANASVNTIADIWRGGQHPKKLHLLDNDFFGNPQWRERIAEIRDGQFRVCLSQGINVRLIDREAAAALASIEYRDTKFSRRRLYTAWDNLKDETIFFRGVDLLEAAGIPPNHLVCYMLIGFDPAETWDRIWRRFNHMVERGILPYPMVHNSSRHRADLVAFQRWVVTGIYRFKPWNEYIRSTRSVESTLAFERAAAQIVTPTFTSTQKHSNSVPNHCARKRA